jgi:cytidylate kinase
VIGFVVAVDGPAASGKGTLAIKLGAAFALPVLDTGLLYRAVGVLVRLEGEDPDDPVTATAAARRLDLNELENLDLTGRAAGDLASRVAVHPPVRDALFRLQRDFGLRPGGAVLDGRDIGTVIFPEAPAKLFVTAAPEVRAERRWRQLVARDPTISMDEVLADIRARDARDGGREAAPMRPAADAVLLDTTDLDIEQAFDAARRIVEAARDQWRAKAF